MNYSSNAHITLQSRGEGLEFKQRTLGQMVSVSFRSHSERFEVRTRTDGQVIWCFFAAQVFVSVCGFLGKLVMATRVSLVDKELNMRLCFFWFVERIQHPSL